MKVSDLTRSALKWRKEKKRLLAQGYRQHETDWEILRGGRQGEVIIDAVISSCGKYIYTKLGKREASNG
jgi:hypothetical protein